MNQEDESKIKKSNKEDIKNMRLNNNKPDIFDKN